MDTIMGLLCGTCASELQRAESVQHNDRRLLHINVPYRLLRLLRDVAVCGDRGESLHHDAVAAVCTIQLKQADGYARQKLHGRSRHS